MRTTSIGLIAVGLLACGGRVDLNAGDGNLIGQPGPDGGASPRQPDPGGSTSATGTSATGTSPTGSSTGSTGSSTGLVGLLGQACWFGQLPDEPPVMPHLSVESACALAPSVTPMRDMGGVSADARGAFVGRWVACGVGGLSPVPHAGVEFGANGRWRLLSTDASGALVPSTSQDSHAYGRYYALSTTQLEMRGEAFEFAATVSTTLGGDRDVLVTGSIDMPAGTSGYARTTPSPDNGWDNVPSITDGKCSMVGTWDLPENSSPPGAPAATFSFDALGNFVGGPLDSDLCASHTMYGTYRLSPGLFQLTSNVGVGACAWWFDAGYPATFDESCTHLSLAQMYDNCTGGRGYFNQQTQLTKRQ